MIRERTALERRNKSMEESYYIYRTTWAEDWPQFCELTFFRDLFRERIQNRFEIFSLFYPMVGIAVSIVISIIVAIISKNFFIGVAAFAALAVIIVIVYSIYFAILSQRVKKLNNLIGHFYTKYGRNVMKDLYKKYGPDELPPQPERYYNLDEDQYGEDETLEGEDEQDDAAEEEAGATETPAATEGIDLRLKQHDDVSTAGDVVVDNICSPGEAEKDEEGDRTRKPESPISEEAEGDEAEDVFIEAVSVIDADLPSGLDDELVDNNRDQYIIQETVETVPDEDVPEDIGVIDESEIELIFSEDEQEEDEENSNLTLADLFDDFSDEDYKEDMEDVDVEEEAKSTDEDLVEETSKESEDIETIDEKLFEGEQEEIETEELAEEEAEAETEETEEETEELTENEEGGEENSRLFPEGYNPTIAELRAALRALSSYN